MFDTRQVPYRDFRDIVAERTSSVVAWVGAGLSRAAGLPTWTELRDSLCDALEKKCRTLDGADKERLLGKLDHATRAGTLWTAFDILHEALGRTSYRTEIRRQLDRATTVAVPRLYNALWSLRLGGVLNLNLDRLATRAHSESHPGKHVNEFSGKHVGHHVHLLKAPDPFIVNLHGVCADESTWVLRNYELSRLLLNAAYRQFISACLMTRTVLFIGLSADDLAVGGHLQALRELDIEPGSHFWLTDRTDIETDMWAEDVGIRVIRYRASNDDHSALLHFFDDVKSYLPKERDAKPVAPPPPLFPVEPLPEPNELQAFSSERIRNILNAHARALLKDGDRQAYIDYEAFCRKYDAAIYRAWYITTTPPDNNVLGFTIEDEIAHGAFGTVYRATAPNGDNVAIKVLHGGIRTNPEMLQSFRRGVRSMEILATSDVTGMIPYREASEIPAFAVMDFVDGPNLNEAVACHYLDEWSAVLRVAVDLANTIHKAHMLPERVLHRDIRPANIMLRNYHTDPDGWELVVLDFDLSWHRGACELSVAASEGVNGFLAPEQVYRSGRASTRNAAVDSFGVGMTLYFLRTGVEPMFAQHQHRRWNEDLEEAIAGYPCESWHSLPRRFARVVACAARHEQAERWDMSQICGELMRLKDAQLNPSSVMSAELLAEEMVARSTAGSRYKWDPDRLECVIDLQSGFRVCVTALETARKVRIELNWLSTGQQERRKIKKWLDSARDQSASVLRKSGWTIREASRGSEQVRIICEIATNALRRRLGDAARALDRAIEALSFE